MLIGANQYQIEAIGIANFGVFDVDNIERHAMPIGSIAKGGATSVAAPPNLSKVNFPCTRSNVEICRSSHKCGMREPGAADGK